MGNGTIVLSLAVWKGRVQLGGVIVEGEFKVFDSGGQLGFPLGETTITGVLYKAGI